MCVLGTVLPYSALVAWGLEHGGLDMVAMAAEVARSRMSTFAWLDVLVSAVVLICFVLHEGTPAIADRLVDADRRDVPRGRVVGAAAVPADAGAGDAQQAADPWRACGKIGDSLGTEIRTVVNTDMPPRAQVALLIDFENLVRSVDTEAVDLRRFAPSSPKSSGRIQMG